MGVYHFTVNDHDEHCKKAAEILQKEKITWNQISRKNSHFVDCIVIYIFNFFFKPRQEPGVSSSCFSTPAIFEF